MRSFFGIPAHALLVHIPAVLLPLAAVGVVVMLIRPAWHLQYRWAVLAVGFVGAVGAIFAADAGENLADQIVAKEGAAASARWADHAEAGDTARLFAVIFLVILAAYILIPWFMERRSKQGNPQTAPRWVAVSLAVLILAGSAATVITVVIAGHSGAKAVWCELHTPPDCAAGG